MDLIVLAGIEDLGPDRPLLPPPLTKSAIRKHTSTAASPSTVKLRLTDLPGMSPTKSLVDSPCVFVQRLGSAPFQLKLCLWSRLLSRIPISVAFNI